MDSIERMAESISAETPETVKESDNVIKALYDVGAKITEVITKITEMSEKMTTEKETETETETETEIDTESED